MFSRGEFRLLGLASALFLAGVAWRGVSAHLSLPPLEIQGTPLSWTEEPAEIESDSFVPSPKKTAHRESSKKISGSLNPNTATIEELATLPGIGPALARRIAEERSSGAFQNSDDLERVKGIGPSKLAKLRTHLTF